MINKIICLVILFLVSSTFNFSIAKKKEKLIKQTAVIMCEQIAGTVFYDYNEDGCQASTIDGVSSVTIDLYRCNTNGTRTMIASTITGTDGSYVFSGTDPTTGNCLLNGSSYQTQIRSLPSNHTHSTGNAGGSGSSGDRRTDLLASRDRIGFGASATGGTNYVFPTTEYELRIAANTPGNYVCLDNFAGMRVGLRDVLYMNSNVTVDGSKAPGAVFYPDYSNGFPSSEPALNTGSPLIGMFNGGNNILHCMKLDGERTFPYQSNTNKGYNTGGINISAPNVWVDHTTVTGFWDDAYLVRGPGDNVTFSNIKCYDTDKGVSDYFPNDNNRHITMFYNDIAAAQRLPSFNGNLAHSFNNYIHDAKYGATVANIIPSVSTIVSQHNVFENTLAHAEQATAPAIIYAGGSIYNGNSTSGNIVGLAGAPSFPYNFSSHLLPASQVKNYTLTHAGVDGEKSTPGGSICPTDNDDSPANDGVSACYNPSNTDSTDGDSDEHIDFGIVPGNVSCSAIQTISSTCGLSNGQAMVTATGGITPYSYTWSNGQGTATATGLSAGSHTVTVSDGNSTSVCTVIITDQGSPVCSITATMPTCGESNGEAIASVQGGTQPYTFAWNDAQAQATATASGLAAGTYAVTIKDVNNCSSICSITLTDPGALSCTIQETAAPSPGVSDGIATVIPSGGAGSSGDPRTDLLASPDRIGYGASASGGSNYVYVSNFNQLKNALETAGNYVLLDPSVAGSGIGFTDKVNVASNTTLDGSLAPASWLYPDYNAGFPSNQFLLNYFGTTNNIIHSIEVRGGRVNPYNSNHPSASVAAINLRGSTAWLDHLTITEFWGQSIMVTQGGNNASFSNLKFYNTNYGLWLYFPNETPRYISLFNSEFDVNQSLHNEGASHFHMWNNYLHNALWHAAITGVAEFEPVGQTGPVRTSSENNVFSNNQAFAQYGLELGNGYGGAVRIPGYVYSKGAQYNNGDVATGHVISGNAPWAIPYTYETMPTNEVQAYVIAHAGKISSGGGGGGPVYTYQWNDPEQQTTAVASGLPAGTYTVTVTDGANCTTVCSIILSGACQPKLANDNALTGVQSVSQDYETDGAIESSQMIINNSIVDYDSGQSILLKNDFEVLKGSTFHAFIDGCGGTM